MLETSPKIMGVLNVSPDSFYKPCLSLSEVVDRAGMMIEQGVDVLDVGGEATNPHLEWTTSDQLRAGLDTAVELQRVLPAIEAILQHYPAASISVDTSNAHVMAAAIEAGARMINDQRALRLPGALEVVIKAQVPVCLMHLFIPRRQPGSCAPAHLLQMILQDLQTLLQSYLARGLRAEQIMIDPGFGGGHYGKNTAENFYLLRRLPDFLQLGYPVLIGWSRKSMIGDVLGGVPAEARLSGSLAATALALLNGAHWIRCHDVRETREVAEVIRYYKGIQL